MDNETQARFDRMEQMMVKIAEGLDRNIEFMGQLTESISRYVDAADARMKRIEENLDALIRAITSEHSNGKGKH